MKTFAPPTPDQLAALVAFREEMGRRWKSQLNDIYWPNARVWIDRNGTKDHGYELHALRNSHGPRWLANYRLPPCSGDTPL